MSNWQPWVTKRERVTLKRLCRPEKGRTKSRSCSSPAVPLMMAHWAFWAVNEQWKLAETPSAKSKVPENSRGTAGTPSACTDSRWMRPLTRTGRA